MACTLLTRSILTVTFWIALLFAFGMDLADSCRPHCTRNYCVTVHRAKVDFESADEICRSKKGQLLTLQTNDDILHALNFEVYGDFWIGLKLPESACSNLSAPLRGYEWTDKNNNVNLTFWKDSAKVCSPGCVSTSHDLKWTERKCSQEIDGFLCMTDHKHACQFKEMSDYFKSTKGCLDGPCEHICTEVKDGYRCSCFKGYAPVSDNPKHCKLHCGDAKCPPVCDPNDDSVCFCPDGFIMNEHVCEDIDECAMQQQCEQKCQNTNGSFKCSCYKGFSLMNQVKCTQMEGTEHSGLTTPIVPAFVKPNNSTLKASSLSTGEFVWLWICLAVVLIALICVVRFYALKRQKMTQQNSTQQMTVTQEVNTQC